MEGTGKLCPIGIIGGHCETIKSHKNFAAVWNATKNVEKKGQIPETSITRFSQQRALKASKTNEISNTVSSHPVSTWSTVFDYIFITVGLKKRSSR